MCLRSRSTNEKAVRRGGLRRADARTRTADPFITRDRKPGHTGPLECTAGQKSPSISSDHEVPGATDEDARGHGGVRGEYAGEGADDDPHLAGEQVHRDRFEIERLAEWYVTRSAGDPRYGEAADLLVALAIVLTYLADALDSKGQRT
jgi:hypothetical protein